MADDFAFLNAICKKHKDAEIRAYFDVQIAQVEGLAKFMHTIIECGGEEITQAMRDQMVVTDKNLERVKRDYAEFKRRTDDVPS